MKLYTEEQVTKLTSAAFVAGQNHNTFIFGEAFKDITPIELPTDEEIFQKSIEIMEEWYGNGCKTEIDAHFRGAKWMRDKIQGGNE